MEQKIFRIPGLVFLIVSSLLCGCGEDSPEEKEAIQVNQTFPKIQHHGMELKIISTLASFRIKDAAPQITFQFINEGLSRVQIAEWKQVERDNIKVQFAECPMEGGAEKLPEEAWQDSPRKISKGDSPRYPIDLDPKSSVILTMPLSFIRDLKKPGRYAVRGVMDLSSMDVKSSPIELIIRN
ncbi:MAG: hypothetical protein IKB25_04270 [Lentisphaeria bacterium]|nr:hypothetical protein [Lentisphaeria bacterium]